MSQKYKEGRREKREGGGRVRRENRRERRRERGRRERIGESEGGEREIILITDPEKFI